MTWQPRLPASGNTLHEKLIAALERDIADGVLQVGARLPPHRELAHHLGIGIGTVTKAYAEAERKGLLIAHVGRGSFVAGAPRADSVEGISGSRIDMANNLPFLGPAEDRLSGALSQLRRRPELSSYAGYGPAGGFEAHRRAAAAWLARTAGFETVNWSNLVLCGGAQDATALVAAHLCKPGDTILTEAATFFGMKNLADYAGYRLHGVAMDEQGLEPEALDRAAKGGARVLYTIPTLQNPTGRIIGAKRRAEIVRIARARDLWIIEDDVYGGLLSTPLEPLATLAPERTFYINSASKTLAPGLRTGFLITPNATHFDQILRAIRARSVTGSALGSLIATQWIEDGTADAILAAVRTEMRARTRLAVDILGASVAPLASEHSLHIWLPMPELEAERTAGRALLSGVEMTSPSAPIIDRELIYGLRLCLGGAPNRATLETGLRAVAAAMTSSTSAPSRDVV